MNTNTILWLLILGILDIVAVFFVLRRGLVHPDHAPEKPQDSQAVQKLLAINAERLAKVEAGRAKALASGETKPA